MRTSVDPAGLLAGSRRLRDAAAELADARGALAAVHVSAAPDLGRAGAEAAEATWRAGDSALRSVAAGCTELADALSLLARVYAEVDREAVR